MSDDNEPNEAEARRKKKGDSGEGDSDSWGRGKAGACASPEAVQAGSRCCRAGARQEEAVRHVL